MLLRVVVLADVAAAIVGCDGSFFSSDASDSAVAHADAPAVDSGPRDVAAPVVGPLDGALAASLEAVVAKAFEEVEAPGVVAGVYLTRSGQAWTSGTGLAKVEPPVDVAPDDRFRIGSITKTFTAAVLLQLVEEGRVRLSDPVSDYVPGFELDPAVTLETVLSHTSGIFNYTDDTSFLIEAQRDTEPRDVIAFALDHDPYFAPGQGYTYSNTGFFFVGLAIEAVTGRAYHEEVRARLLEPRGLGDTWLDHVESHDPPLVDGHVLGTDADSVDFSMSWAWAAGGLASNTADLCSWLEQLYLGDVLGVAMRERMKTPLVLPNGNTTTYGLGARLAQRAGRAVIGHTGSTMGFTAEVFLEPDSGVCIAVLANDFLGEPKVLADPLWSAALTWLTSQR